jgi:hypothetical protein
VEVGSSGRQNNHAGSGSWQGRKEGRKEGRNEGKKARFGESRLILISSLQQATFGGRGVKCSWLMWSGPTDRPTVRPSGPYDVWLH